VLFSVKNINRVKAENEYLQNLRAIPGQNRFLMVRYYRPNIGRKELVFNADY
jgi:hypothetical protein